VNYSKRSNIGNDDAYKSKCWTSKELSLLSETERFVSLSLSPAAGNHEESRSTVRGT
jgi:hypothetical protein